MWRQQLGSPWQVRWRGMGPPAPDTTGTPPDLWKGRADMSLEETFSVRGYPVDGTYFLRQPDNRAQYWFSNQPLMVLP